MLRAGTGIFSLVTPSQGNINKTMSFTGEVFLLFFGGFILLVFRTTAMGLKNMYEQISVGHFCGKHAMGAKKTEIVPFFFFFVGLCFFCGHQRK